MTPRIRRRALLGFAASAAAVGLGGFAEYESFQGKFDHRRAPPASGKERYDASMKALGSAAAIVHVGHSTHLIAMNGLRVLTDPWFFDPAFGALSHDPNPAVRPDDLGPLDVVLVTHDHADHADLRAMDRMDKRATVLVATDDLRARIKALGFGDVAVVAPWETRKVRDLEITAVPAQHDIYEIGFVLGKSVYFAGDTRLHPDLDAIAERFTPHTSILPVDGTRLAGGALHVMTPEDAVVAAKKLKSAVVMPSHAEAYFSDPIAGHLLASTVDGAKEKFRVAMKRDLPEVRCEVPEPGAMVRLG